MLGGRFCSLYGMRGEGCLYLGQQCCGVLVRLLSRPLRAPLGQRDEVRFQRWRQRHLVSALGHLQSGQVSRRLPLTSQRPYCLPGSIQLVTNHGADPPTPRPRTADPCRRETAPPRYTRAGPFVPVRRSQRALSSPEVRAAQMLLGLHWARFAASADVSHGESLISAFSSSHPGGLARTTSGSRSAADWCNRPRAGHP